MCQVLFTISIFGLQIPIHGYGLMLFIAFVVCLILGLQLAKRQGIGAETVQDVALWMFVPGLIGARLLFALTEWRYFSSHPERILYIWDGGLVFYGSAIGGLVGFAGAYLFVLRPRGIGAFTMLDMVAPCAALGLAIGRIGCLLNGCCYGHVACVDCPAVYFPLPAEPNRQLVARGLQTAAGFLVDVNSLVVTAVEPDSPAAAAGLQVGDRITKVDGNAIKEYPTLDMVFANWQRTHRGRNRLEMTVQREGREVELVFTPRSIGLHPTQIYESISAGLLTFLLLSFYPLRRFPGQVMGLMMVGYALHRFINEIIRNDTPPVFAGLTLSQNVSVLMLLIGAALFLFSGRLTKQTAAAPPMKADSEPASQPESPPETALYD